MNKLFNPGVELRMTDGDLINTEIRAVLAQSPRIKREAMKVKIFKAEHFSKLSTLNAILAAKTANELLYELFAPKYMNRDSTEPSHPVRETNDTHVYFVSPSCPLVPNKMSVIVQDSAVDRNELFKQINSGLSALNGPVKVTIEEIE